MTETKQYHVFICHTTEDKTLVRELYSRLIRDGIDVWFDEERLLPGQDWRLEISRAVRNSETILVILSSQSVKKTGYVQKEIRLALDIAGEKPEGEIYLIPARLDDCVVPDSLRNYHWVNLFDHNGYEKVKQAIKARSNLPTIEIPVYSDRTVITASKSVQDDKQKLQPLFTTSISELKEQTIEDFIRKKYDKSIQFKTVSAGPPPSVYGASSWSSTKTIVDYSEIKILFRSLRDEVMKINKLDKTGQELITDLMLTTFLLRDEDKQYKRFYRDKEVMKHVDAIANGSGGEYSLAFVKLAIQRVLCA